MKALTGGDGVVSRFVSTKGMLGILIGSKVKSVSRTCAQDDRVDTSPEGFCSLCGGDL